MPSPTPAIVGTARRDYEGIGNLRLRGVFTEAVIARSGYAGAVTYLVDDKGTLYTRSDIAPGDASRAAGAYDATIYSYDRKGRLDTVTGPAGNTWGLGRRWAQLHLVQTNHWLH